MLYLLIQEKCEEYYGYHDNNFIETVIGVYESEELAKKEIESIILEKEKDYENSDCEFNRIEDGYHIVSWTHDEETYTYNIMQITELNKRIE